ncbi:hypothetical protein NC652_017148 [Populus alba x Populus x berolinensis]|nr:hypothetical protein NC652_017148 [Populus alba x Populus x berolinensis]
MKYIFNTQVPDGILIDRCVGRRLEPVTGKIYHVKNSPQETVLKAKLITYPDDTGKKGMPSVTVVLCSSFYCDIYY